MNKFLVSIFWGTPGVQRSIERLLVILIIGILAAIMIHAYLPLVSKAKVFNGAIFGFEKYKREIAYHWALSGEWPENESKIELFHSDPFYKEGARYIEKADLENGAIHVFIKNSLAGRVLTCRPAVLNENSTGPVIWICGSGQTGSSAWTLAGPDRTTIESFYIPKSLQYY
jgi:type II secretory pathway pseudopilin PulG